MPTIEQQILTRLDKIDRKLERDDWMTAEQIKAEFNLSKKFLQTARKDMRIKTVKCLPSGKNILYKRTEIEDLFITIKN